MTHKDIKPVLVLQKAIIALESMLQAPQNFTLSEISKVTKINKSTLYRILNTFKENGYVIQNEQDSKYRLGYKFLEYGSVAADLDVRNIANPYMQSLSKQTGEITHLVIRDGDYGVYIDKVDSFISGNIRMISSVGRRTHLHCTSVGKVLLSELEFEKVEQIISAVGMPKKTKATITNSADLFEELRKVRAQGYAVDNVENEENVRCVAAPIRDSNNIIIAAISVSGTVLSVKEENVPQIADLVMNAASGISRALGCKLK